MQEPCTTFSRAYSTPLSALHASLWVGLRRTAHTESSQHDLAPCRQQPHTAVGFSRDARHRNIPSAIRRSGPQGSRQGGQGGADEGCECAAVDRADLRPATGDEAPLGRARSGACLHMHTEEQSPRTRQRVVHHGGPHDEGPKTAEQGAKDALCFSSRVAFLHDTLRRRRAKARARVIFSSFSVIMSNETQPRPRGDDGRVCMRLSTLKTYFFFLTSSETYPNHRLT